METEDDVPFYKRADLAHWNPTVLSYLAKRKEEAATPEVDPAQPPAATVAPPPAAPPPPAPTGDQELADAQRMDTAMGYFAKGNALGNLAAQQFAYAGTDLQGHEKDNTALFTQGLPSAVGNLKERRASGMALAEQDPNSPESQRARAVLKSVIGEKRWTPAHERLSASAIGKSFPLIKEQIDSIQAREKAEAERAQRVADEAAKNDREKGEEAARWERDREYQDKARRENNAAQLEAARIARGDQKAQHAGDVVRQGTVELRKEFNALPEVKSYNEVSISYDKVRRSAENPSAAGDLSLIFGYMKMLDPGSSVREGEQASAQNAGGVGDRIIAQYNKLLDGERLSPSQRADFLARSKGLFDSHEQQYEKQAQRYRQLAERQGLSPDDIVAGPKAPRSQKDEQALEWARANPSDPRAVIILKANGE